MVMKKFIEVTDTREPVGVEEIRMRNTLLNVDQIVSIESVELHIAEHVGYNTCITTINGTYRVLEKMSHFKNLLF